MSKKLLLLVLLATLPGHSLWAQTGDVQASDLAFATVAGRSVRLTWTRGNLDGVIVVMRLSTTGIVAPADGDDYTGNPDFGAPPPELPTNSQNYVVYKGPGTSVLVTGLTMSTSYSVAVYEYSGTGASTTYLAGPVEATGSTTDYAVHNYDFRADCDDCHNHTSFGAQGPELKAICSTCHNPTGLASNKLEFGFEETPTTTGHPTPTRNPGIDVVDCGMCHEVHNHTPTSTNTTYSTHSVTLVEQHNLAFLRANVDKYVPNAATPAYLHTDTPGVDTPDRAVEGGNDTTARGYCQVCHTLTNYHRSSDTASADQCHDGGSNTSCGPAEVHCGSCHEHNNNFAGAGGSCTGCHSSVQGTRPVITAQFDRLSSHVPGGSAAVTSEDCEVCHDQSTHQTQTVRIFDADNGGTSYAQSTAGASTLATGEGEDFAPACLSCHDSNGAGRLPGTGDQTPASPFTGSGAPAVVDATRWASASHNRPTPSSAPVSCVGDGANGCHGSGHGSEQNWLLAPAGGATASITDFCYVCHDVDGPSTLDISTQFTDLANAPNVQPVTSGTGYLNADNYHDTTVATCIECHAPHVNNNASPVADPDDDSALRAYSFTSSYTEDGATLVYGVAGTHSDPTNPEGGSSVPEDDYIQFCLTCHDGTAPPNVSMPATILNMADAYLSDQHGAGDGSTGSTTSKGGMKTPWVTAGDDAVNNDPTQPYAAMNCTTCHGAHGTGNIYNLRESITVAGVTMSIGGVGNMPVPARISDPTVYTLPPMNGRNVDEVNGFQEDHYWGAWCSFCHKMDSHRVLAEEDSCTNAHQHGAGSF